MLHHRPLGHQLVGFGCVLDVPPKLNVLGAAVTDGDELNALKCEGKGVDVDAVRFCANRDWETKVVLVPSSSSAVLLDNGSG